MSCAACFAGSVHAGTPTGADVELPLEGAPAVPAYYAAPPAASTAAICILSDVFGFKFINVRLLADVYASKGFHVFVPDYFGGTAVPHESLAVMDEAPTTGLTFIGNGFRMLGAVLGGGVLSFIASHGAAVTEPRARAALAAVRARAAALGAPKLGAIGFCFGAPYTLRAAARGDVDAYAVAHPSSVALPADAAPLAGKRGLWCLAETDMAVRLRAAPDARGARRALTPLSPHTVWPQGRRAGKGAARRQGRNFYRVQGRFARLCRARRRAHGRRASKVRGRRRELFRRGARLRAR